MPNGPQASIVFEEQTVIVPGSKAGDSSFDNLLRAVGVAIRGIAQLAGTVLAHCPQTAIAFEKAVQPSGCGGELLEAALP